MLARILILSSILAATFGCGAASSDEIVLDPTEVGTPVGDKVSKEIGPQGGTLTSPDNRLTLTVPPNAVSENVSFSIQPISNNVQDAIGPAYRLEPSGRVSSAPLEISIRYTEQDIEGAFPQTLHIAYQDEKRAWHEQSSAKLDAATRTITVSTTHLSDWSFYMGEYIKIVPSRADVRVGKSVKLNVQSCQFNYWFAWIIYGRKKVCEEKGWSSETGFPYKLNGSGTLKGEFPGALYTAPATQPKPNVVTVTYQAPMFPKDISALEAKIRIIGQGYRATGTYEGMTFSGEICSLDRPFKITGKTQLTFQFDFTPSYAGGSSAGESSTGAIPTTGSVAIGGGGMGITISAGSGTYTVEGIDTDRPRIALTGTFAGSYPGAGTAQGGGPRYIDLIPTETTEDCGDAPPPPPTPKPWIQDPRLKKKRGL